MVHYSKIVQALMDYIDQDLIQKMNGSWKAWVVGSVATLVSAKAPGLIETLNQNPMIRSLKVLDGEMVDIDTIYAHLLEQAQKRSATIDIPLVGAVTYTANDVENIYRLIKR